jgi:hypothetical protein
VVVRSEECPVIHAEDRAAAEVTGGATRQRRVRQGKRRHGIS